MLYSRPDCHLCEEMLRELQAIAQASAYAVDIVDIDGEPAARKRYGHKIPVLLLAGELVCHGRLDAEEVHKALAVLR